MSTVQGAVGRNGMADVGRELNWWEWVKRTSLKAEEYTCKPWLCKLLGEYIKYAGNSSLVEKKLDHLGNKAENTLIQACCALFVLMHSTTALRNYIAPHLEKCSCKHNERHQSFQTLKFFDPKLKLYTTARTAITLNIIHVLLLRI